MAWLSFVCSTCDQKNKIISIDQMGPTVDDRYRPTLTAWNVRLRYVWWQLMNSIILFCMGGWETLSHHQNLTFPSFPFLTVGWAPFQIQMTSTSFQIPPTRSVRVFKGDRKREKGRASQVSNQSPWKENSGKGGDFFTSSVSASNADTYVTGDNRDIAM